MLLNILLSEGDLTYKLVYLGLYLVVIVLSFSFHEFAHAFAAHKMGDDTARNLGRMTLNPMVHIEPTGFLLLLIVGFGWAKPVPVNPRNYRKYRLGEFVVSFAGIFTNLILALIAAFFYVVAAFIEYKSGSELPAFLFTFLNLLGIINVSLAVFNFLPVYPLDGAHIFELAFGKLIGAKAVMWLRNYGRFILYGIFGLTFILGRFFNIYPLSGITTWIYSKFVALFALVANLFV